MDLSLAGLVAEVGQTLRDPRDGVRRILAAAPSMQARWLGLAIIAIGSAILTHLSFLLFPEAEQDPLMQFMSGPLRSAALQGVLFLAVAQLVWRLGRLRGGKGSFADALLIMVWLQFIMLVVQAALMVLMAVAPPLAVLANLAGLGLFFWLLTNFVAELHGFRSLPAVFGGIVFGAILLAFGLAFLLLLFNGGKVG
jgi:hypothetical protein